MKTDDNKLHETSVHLTSASSFSILSEAPLGARSSKRQPSSSKSCGTAQRAQDRFMQPPSQDPICTTFRGLPEPKATLPSGRKRGFCGVETPSDAKLLGKSNGRQAVPPARFELTVASTWCSVHCWFDWDRAIVRGTKPRDCFLFGRHGGGRVVWTAVSLSIEEASG